MVRIASPVAYLERRRTTELRRLDCLRELAELIDDEVIVVTSLGGVRVEWHTVAPRPLNFNAHNLGLASSVALGLALAVPSRRVVCLDGDASLLANLGSLTTAAYVRCPNLVHVVFDNASHESCGGLPTATSNTADLGAIAAGSGRQAHYASTVEEFTTSFRDLSESDQGGFIHCITRSVVEPDMVAVPYDMVELKHRFMRALPEAAEMLELPPPMHIIATSGGR